MKAVLVKSIVLLLRIFPIRQMACIIYNMASANETVLLQSTLEIQNKAYSVKLTASEIYWETITSARKQPVVHTLSL